MKTLPTVVLLALLLHAGSGARAAALHVGAGATVDLGTARLDLGCADLTVAGTLLAANADVDAAQDVYIAPGGTLEGQNGMLVVTGDWDNQGTFSNGSSVVAMTDGCGRSTATISGSTFFSTLMLTTVTGRTWLVEAGSTQTMSVLHLVGAAGSLLNLRSTVPGLEAFTNLLGGNQSISYVDVADNHAVGNALVLPSNSVASGNAEGWGFASAVPALPVTGLLLLGGLAVGLLRRVARRVE